tara:strand:+ start:2308 stop:2838 length:531 start_codon:yes stop_codon:yes gene_type:complete
MAQAEAWYLRLEMMVAWVVVGMMLICCCFCVIGRVNPVEFVGGIVRGVWVGVFDCCCSSNFDKDLRKAESLDYGPRSGVPQDRETGRFLFNEELLPNERMERESDGRRPGGSGYDDRELVYQIRRLREEVVNRLGHDDGSSETDETKGDTPLLSLAMEQLHKDRLLSDESRLKLFV